MIEDQRGAVEEGDARAVEKLAAAAVAHLERAAADRGRAAVRVTSGKRQHGGPGLGQRRGPAIVSNHAAIVRLAGVMTISSPLAEPANVPPLMLPDVLPIRPPPANVSAGTAHRDRQGAGQVQGVERLGGSDGGLRTGGLDVLCAIGGQRAEVRCCVGAVSHNIRAVPGSPIRAADGGISAEDSGRGFGLVVVMPLLADCVPLGSVKSIVPPGLRLRLPMLKSIGFEVAAVRTTAELPGLIAGAVEALAIGRAGLTLDQERAAA